MTTERLRFQIAKTEVEKARIYRLRYDAYLAEGAIEQNPDGMFKDKYDECDAQILCALFADNWLVGSIRLHLIEHKESASPALSVFANEMQWYLAEQVTILDPNRLCLIRTNSSNQRYRLMYLLRLVFMAAEHFDAGYVTATSRPNHMRLYKRLFGGKLIAEPRTYPGLLKPHGLMISNFQENKADIISKLPAFESNSNEHNNPIFNSCRL